VARHTNYCDHSITSHN